MYGPRWTIYEHIVILEFAMPPYCGLNNTHVFITHASQILLETSGYGSRWTIYEHIVILEFALPPYCGLNNTHVFITHASQILLETSGSAFYMF